MSEQQRPQHAITNATNGETSYVPFSDAEWDELRAKQSRVDAEREAEAAAEIAAQAEVETLKKVIDARPTDDDIKNAKTTDLKDLILKQNAVIDVILKKLGLIV